MRFYFSRSLFSSFLVSVVLLASHSLAFGQITPKIETTVGSGSNVSYFVLDFLSGSTPQSYAFAYRYEGSKTGGDLIDALAAGAPSFTVQSQQFSFGRFYKGFGYADKFLTTPQDFSNYWSYWTATDGQNWTSPQDFGADGRTLADGSWDGWSYVLGGVTAAPRTPLLAATAAPEPGTFTLLAVGGISGAGIVLRRRRKTAGK